MKTLLSFTLWDGDGVMGCVGVCMLDLQIIQKRQMIADKAFVCSLFVTVH